MLMRRGSRRLTQGRSLPSLSLRIPPFTLHNNIPPPRLMLLRREILSFPLDMARMLFPLPLSFPLKLLPPSIKLVPPPVAVLRLLLVVVLALALPVPSFALAVVSFARVGAVGVVAGVRHAWWW